MEDNKLREQDFLVASISQLSISGSSSPPVVARFRSDSLLFGSESDSSDSVQFDLSNCQVLEYLFVFIRGFCLCLEVFLSES